MKIVLCYCLPKFTKTVTYSVDINNIYRYNTPLSAAWQQYRQTLLSNLQGNGITRNNVLQMTVVRSEKSSSVLAASHEPVDRPHIKVISKLNAVITGDLLHLASRGYTVRCRSCMCQQQTNLLTIPGKEDLYSLFMLGPLLLIPLELDPTPHLVPNVTLWTKGSTKPTGFKQPETVSEHL